jgi:phage terminase Nu1 subunit (DNA packaging protein)
MNWVNKERLAECLDVSIRSVERYQSLGMPHKKNEVKAFKVGWCIHWYIGYQEAKAYELRERNGLVLTLFGYAVAGNNQAKLKQKAHELAKVMNYQDIEIGIAIGILRQRNLIPSRS